MLITGLVKLFLFVPSAPTRVCHLQFICSWRQAFVPKGRPKPDNLNVLCVSPPFSTLLQIKRRLLQPTLFSFGRALLPQQGMLCLPSPTPQAHLASCCLLFSPLAGTAASLLPSTLCREGAAGVLHHFPGLSPIFACIQRKSSAGAIFRTLSGTTLSSLEMCHCGWPSPIQPLQLPSFSLVMVFPTFQVSGMQWFGLLFHVKAVLLWRRVIFLPLIPAGVRKCVLCPAVLATEHQQPATCCIGWAPLTASRAVFPCVPKEKASCGPSSLKKGQGLNHCLPLFWCVVHFFFFCVCVCGFVCCVSWFFVCFG